ncbi:PEP-CTERM sorting domain-containing protein [Rariglobus hedericola]|nr:PEP-CTERM sorting domain-containing protein [Rariglobus hedericola]
MKLLVVMLGAVFTAHLNAATLAGWDFNGQVGASNVWGPSPFAATSLSAGVVSASLGLGFTTSQSGTSASKAWGTNGWSSTATTASAALAANNWITITLNADAGYTMSLASIDAFNVRRSASGPITGLLQYSVDSGTSFNDIGSAITWGNVTTSSGNAVASIDLSGIVDLQNVASVTFRILNYGATGASGTWYLNEPTATAGVSDFTLSGTTALSQVPEPSTYAMVLGGLVLTIVVAQRRRQSTAKRS